MPIDTEKVPVDEIKKQIVRGEFDKTTKRGTGLQRLKNIIDELLKGGHISEEGANELRIFWATRTESEKELEDQGLQPTEDVGGVLDDQDD